MRWEEKPLSDILEANRAITYGVVKPGDEDPDGVQFIRGGDISEGKIAIEALRTITQAISDSYGRTLLKGGELLISLVGNPGEVALVPPSLVGGNIARQVGLIPLNQTVDSAFVMYFLKSPRGRAEMRSRTGGAVQQVINLADIRTIPVPVPDLKIQQSIASILTAYDDLIENNRRRMDLLEESARLLYREWFVHLRFPGHATARVSDGIPEGWRKVGLGEVAAVNRENLKKGFEGEIEYIDIATVSPGEIGETCLVDFDEAPSRARRVVRHGDIIWSCVRPNRRSHAVIWNPAENLIASTGFAVLSPTTVPPTFLYGAVTTDDFVGYLENHARGAAYPAVVASDFERSEILVPTPEVLGDFDAVVSTIFDQLHVLRAQTQKLKTARDLLLPKLMSGEIEV